MKTSRAAILGMGLMGGSLAWAIQDRVGSLVAADPDERTRRLVRSADLVEKITADPEDILFGADVIVLAAPVGAILELISCLPRWHPGPALVFDLGSTKVDICRGLAELPTRFDVFGGHPMCGKAVGGFEHADPTLFNGATFAFCALERTSDRARTFANKLARVVGAHPWWVEAEIHDAWVGATSHLPYLMSAAQVLVTPEGALPLMGSGFQSATRLASTPREMMMDVLRTNSSLLLPHLQNIQRVIGDMESLIREGKYHELRSLLDRAASMKAEFDRED